MTRSRLFALLGGVLGALLIAYAIFAGKTDQEQITELLTRLSDTLQVVEPPENPLTRLGRVQGNLKEIATEDIYVQVPELSAMRGRKSVAQAATQTGLTFRSASVGLSRCLFEIKKPSAQVVCNAELRAIDRSGTIRADERKTVFQLVHNSDGWQFDRIQVSEAGSSIDD